jgi:hypothetical protein
MNRRTTLDIHDDYENPEQTFISDEVTPIASEASGFTDVTTFVERIQTMPLKKMQEKRDALLQLIQEYERELNNEYIENDWQSVVFNLLEITRAKARLITRQIDELIED